ncbi:MAG: Mov34/MPN/PAD-1 family protein [Promethearchaeota archaeon]
MNVIEEQYQKIIEKYPDVQIVDNIISHITIKLVNNVILDIDYKKFPKQPKIALIKNTGEKFTNLDMMVSSLKTWKKKEPLDIVHVLNEVLLLVDSTKSSEVLINREFFQSILALCNDQHPREILGMLRMKEGIIREFLLPPGSLRGKNVVVFSPGRIPFDASIAGTVHSHPSGNSSPSPDDISVFKKGHIHFIVAYPYSYYSTRCYDQNGNTLNFRLVD